jgi:magnesium and cobalt transporter
MSEERTSTPWFERIINSFTSEPKSRQQIKEIVREAEQGHTLDSEALSIIEGALQVSEMQVRDIMVPKSQITMVGAEQQPDEFLPLIIESAHSRFPVVSENTDEVQGVLLAKDLLPLLHKNNLDKFQMKEVLRPATFIPESKRLNILLKEFRATRNHMAIVVDEYGSMAGIVTIEDVLEQIVGEIEDEHDIDEDDSFIKSLPNNIHMVKALTTIDDFNDHFKTHFKDDEFDTIGGIVSHNFGRLPERDEVIIIDGLSFKIVNSNNRRISLLEVTGAASSK